MSQDRSKSACSLAWQILQAGSEGTVLLAAAQAVELDSKEEHDGENLLAMFLTSHTGVRDVAIRNAAMVLLDRGVDPFVGIDGSQPCPIMMAFREDRVELLDAMLDRASESVKGFLYKRNDERGEPLVTAAMSTTSSAQMVKVLIRHGFPVDRVNSAGRPSVAYAHSEQVLEMLLEAGADATWCDEVGRRVQVYWTGGSNDQGKQGQMAAILKRQPPVFTFTSHRQAAILDCAVMEASERGSEARQRPFAIVPGSGIDNPNDKAAAVMWLAQAAVLLCDTPRNNDRYARLFLPGETRSDLALWLAPELAQTFRRFGEGRRDKTSGELLGEHMMRAAVVHPNFSQGLTLLVGRPQLMEGALATLLKGESLERLDEQGNRTDLLRRAGTNLAIFLEAALEVRKVTPRGEKAGLAWAWMEPDVGACAIGIKHVLQAASPRLACAMLKSLREAQFRRGNTRRGAIMLEWLAQAVRGWEPCQARDFNDTDLRRSMRFMAKLDNNRLTDLCNACQGITSALAAKRLEARDGEVVRRARSRSRA